MTKCILPSVSPITAKYLRYVDRAITTVMGEIEQNTNISHEAVNISILNIK